VKRQPERGARERCYMAPSAVARPEGARAARKARPMHYLLFYDVVPNYAERRAPYRLEHLELAEQSVQRGHLMLAGALAEPIDGAVFLFQGSSPRVAEAFAEADPYVRNGLVTSWRVRTWPTVVGQGAATPLTSAALRAQTSGR
jgi:uncharacterized protein YciI